MGPVVISAVGIAFGVLSMTPADFTIARVAFASAGVLLMAKTAHWLIKEDTETPRRRLIFGVIASTVLALLWFLLPTG